MGDLEVDKRVSREATHSNPSRYWLMGPDGLGAFKLY